MIIFVYLLFNHNAVKHYPSAGAAGARSKIEPEFLDILVYEQAEDHWTE